MLDSRGAVDVLCASGVLESMPFMAAMARKHFSCSVRPRTAALSNLKLGTRPTGEAIFAPDGTSSKHYVADMHVALLNEGSQFWEFSLKSDTASIRHFAYRMVADAKTAEVLQVDVG